MSLKRPIRHAPEFDAIIPPTSCKPVNLTTGTTAIGLQNMKKWILHSQHHTKALAQKLKGKTLDETVANIHWFVYNHFQYQSDTFMQNLYSPACAWKIRHNGIDCKSYSIIASSILMNLKIAHKIRRIKQPNLKPNVWSHVYVVVTGKKERVIDGTINSLQELPAVKKDDLIMYTETALPYQGLNGPGTSIPVENLLDEFFEEAGASQDFIDKVENAIKTYHNNNINPTFRVMEQGVMVEKTYIPISFRKKVGGMNGWLGSIGGVMSLFKPHTFVGKLGRALSGKGVSISSGSSSANSGSSNQAALIAQQAAAAAEAERARLEAERIKKEEEAAKKRKIWMIIGGVAGGIVVIGGIVYVVKK